jgi:hypothetical protein
MCECCNFPQKLCNNLGEGSLYLYKIINGFKAVAERTFRLVFAMNVKESLSMSDFIVDQPQIWLFNTFDFGKSGEIFRMGLEETEQLNFEIFNSIDLTQVVQEKMNRK